MYLLYCKEYQEFSISSYVLEPDVGMPAPEAQKYFKELIFGLVSDLFILFCIHLFLIILFHFDYISHSLFQKLYLYFFIQTVL